MKWTYKLMLFKWLFFGDPNWDILPCVQPVAQNYGFMLERSKTVFSLGYWSKPLMIDPSPNNPNNVFVLSYIPNTYFFFSAWNEWAEMGFPAAIACHGYPWSLC